MGVGSRGQQHSGFMVVSSWVRPVMMGMLLIIHLDFISILVFSSRFILFSALQTQDVDV